VFFLPSFFYTQLANEGLASVANWTIKQNKKIQVAVFEKKFVFIPIHGNSHWSLAVIINPGLIAKSYRLKDGLLDDNEKASEWPR
jgi:Ulp1 family protease